MDLLKKKKEKVELDAHSREEELIKLIKYSTKVLVDYERRTGEMIQLLYTTRDEQVKS